jgi:hypothetical protein
LPAEWAKLLRTSGILQRVLQVMEENHPARFVVHGDNNGDISPTRAGIELGTTRGYSMYGDRLRLLAEPIKRPADVGETTYEKEEAEIQT